MQHQRWIRFFRTRETLKSDSMSRSLLNATSLNRIGKKSQIHQNHGAHYVVNPSSSSKYWYDAASETIIDGKKKIEEEKKNDKESE